MKHIISLFDMTGNMVRPWAEAGYNCICYDIQNSDTTEHVGLGVIHYVKADLYDNDTKEAIVKLAPVALFAFPPCTDLAVSGAAHFKSKRERNPQYREEAMALVYLARDIGEAVGCPYMIENPVSVISTQWRKPDFKFHPWEYGAYLGEAEAKHPQYSEYIADYDAYPKLTCLWTGNGFTMPTPKAVEPEQGHSRQHKKLGGKSLKTKNIRSATPRGFAKAVFEQQGEQQ